MQQAARKPFWKKKRWITAAVLWLVLLSFPVAPAPFAYVYGRGWLPPEVFDAIDLTLFRAEAELLSLIPGTIGGDSVVGWWRTWNGWWYHLGVRHAAD